VRGGGGRWSRSASRFFALAILPVSNLLFSTGTVLAERTLYLPSVGLAFVVAGLTTAVLAQPARVRRLVAATAVAAAIALFVRTVARNPSWMSTFVVVQTLSDEHPESWRAFRGRAQGLERWAGRATPARSGTRRSVSRRRTTRCSSRPPTSHARTGDAAQAEAYLRDAIRIVPELANAYQHLAAQLLRRGQGLRRIAPRSEGSRAATTGALGRVSESYVAKGDRPPRCGRASLACPRTRPSRRGRAWPSGSMATATPARPRGATRAEAGARGRRREGLSAGGAGPDRIELWGNAHPQQSDRPCATGS
jgi:hypothetical protein